MTIYGKAVSGLEAVDGQILCHGQIAMIDLPKDLRLIGVVQVSSSLSLRERMVNVLRSLFGLTLESRPMYMRVGWQSGETIYTTNFEGRDFQLWQNPKGFDVRWQR